MEEEHEKRVFNLQIQIQKLEEELTLYRNGASGQELFEVIGEKNTELGKMKNTLAEKNDKLKKLAKSSGEVIGKYSSLQAAFERLQADGTAAEQLTKEQAAELESLRGNYNTLSEAHNALVQEDRCKQERICELERELIDANVIIEKLHKRGATLIAEKSEKSKALDKVLYEKADLEKKFQTEVEKLNKAAAGAKKRYDAEHVESTEVKRQYEESQKMIQDVREAITTAQKTNEIAKADMKKIQSSYEAKIQTLKNKMEEMKLTHTESQESLQRMKEDCEKLTAALSQQAMRHAKEIQSREDHWLNEHKRIQKLSETAQMRVGRLEGEKETNITSRRECDILRAKNLELEEKNRRLEQQSKSRFLRDKTNSLPTTSMDDDARICLKSAVTIVPGSGSSTTEAPVAKAPIFPMHHRAPVASSHAPRQGGSTKLHEPGCSMNSHR